MYICGPTVYSRIHIGNARPFCVRAVKRFLEQRGPRCARREHHRHQRQDLRRRPRGPASRSDALAAEMAAAYVEDTDRLGLGRPDVEPLATETIAGDHRPDRAAHRERPRLRGRRRRLLPRRALRRLRRALRPAARGADQGEERRRRAGEQGGPLDFALWKAHKPDEDTGGTRPGAAAGPAGTSSARRWPSRARRRSSTSTAAARTSSSPTTRTRAPRPRRRGRPLRPRLDAQRDARVRRREDVEVGGQHLPAAREALDRYGRETSCCSSLRPLPRSRWTTRGDARQAAAAGERCEPLAAAGAEAPGATAASAAPRPFFDALDDDLSRRGRCGRSDLSQPVARCPRPLAAADGAVRGAARALRRPGGGAERGRPPRSRALAERGAARAARDFARADALRDEIAALGWEVRDTAQGREFRRRAAALVYGRHPVREALRGRRRVREVWQRRRGADAAWLAGAGPRVASREGLDALAGSPDHQGVVARVDAVPVRRPRPTSCRRAAAGAGARTGSPTRTTWAPSRGWRSARARTAWCSPRHRAAQ